MDNKGQIYCIQNIITDKYYIGQTREYYRSGNNYIKYGYLKRWNAHINEAFSQKTNECRKLNNDIRKYGKDTFIINLIHVCNTKFLNHFEKHFVYEYNSYNNGYNMNHGGNSGCVSYEQSLMISKTISNKERILENNNNKNYVLISKIVSNNKTIISVKFYGSITTKHDFGGFHTKFDDSCNRAIKFTQKYIDTNKIYIQDSLKDLDCFKQFQVYNTQEINSNSQKKCAFSNKLEKIKNIVIDSIYLYIINYNTFKTIVLVFKCENKKVKISFGGKLSDINTSINEAFTFINNYCPNYPLYISDDIKILIKNNSETPQLREVP